MSDNDKILFNKKGDNVYSHDEVWDDTELIAMYEESTAKTFQKLQKSASTGDSTTSSNQQTQPAKSESKKWKVGDQCMAPYEDDGRWYMAKIESIKEQNGICEVLYTNYDTKAVVNLEQLMTEDEVEWVGEGTEREDGNGEQIFSLDRAIRELKHPSKTNANINHPFPIPDLCPPPPPSLFSKAVEADNEKMALSNLLMSWYMAGYHAGYYQGFMKTKNGSKQK